MTNNLGMEIRSVDTAERLLVGVVSPYDEVSYLVSDPGGERIIRGAFDKSIAQRGNKIPLHDNHGTQRRMGISRRFEDGPTGLIGHFRVNEGGRGDEFLREMRQGYFGGLSIGFQALRTTRGADGVREVREAKLMEVSAVGMPAYSGAELIAVRRARQLEEALAPFANPPAVNLTPIRQVW